MVAFGTVQRLARRKIIFFLNKFTAKRLPHTDGIIKMYFMIQGSHFSTHRVTQVLKYGYDNRPRYI